MDCVVCTERLNNEIAALMCGHVFHIECVKNWFSRGMSKQACPICKQTFEISNKSRSDKRMVKIYLPDVLDRQMQLNTEDMGGLDRRAIEEKLLQERNRFRAVEEDLRAEIQVQRHSNLNLNTEKEQLEEKVRQLSAHSESEHRKASKLWEKLNETQQSLAACQSEMRRSMAKSSSMEKELEKLRRMQSNFNCYQLVQEGNDDKALEDLQRNNSGDSLLVELKKILNFRHAAFKKLQETSNDMQKEIQRLRTEVERKNALEHAHAARSAESNRQKYLLASRRPVELDPRDRAPSSSSVLDKQRMGAKGPDILAEKQANAEEGEDKENYVNVDVSAASAKIKGKSKGRSLLKPQEGHVVRSNDPDNGGRFIRSGPDGMGGTVNIHPGHTGFNHTFRSQLNSGTTAETSEAKKSNIKRKVVHTESSASIKKFFSNTNV
eukprot:767880-Hanusia_phi.AAC.5